jgi:hypothetical protein
METKAANWLCGWTTPTRALPNSNKSPTRSIQATNNQLPPTSNQNIAKATTQANKSNTKKTRSIQARADPTKTHPNTSKSIPNKENM